MDLSGIINVNKPKGFTSHDVVAKLRKILKIKQIGHTGTLDPSATGVLPVCIGNATKIIQYLESDKAYRAYIMLGIKTDTYDMEGKILEKNPVNVDFEIIKDNLKNFEGEITQTPPIYSAVHYKGKRLYEYARKNIEIPDIPKRSVTVYSINLVEILNNIPLNITDTDTNGEEKYPVLVVDIDCSEGTYIRSIAHDLGEQLGCGACLSDLTRTKAGRFNLENSLSLEEIESSVNSGDFEKIIVNPVDVLPLDKIEAEEDLLIKIKHGQSFPAPQEFKTNPIQLVNNNKLVAIAKIEDNTVKPVNVFI